MTKFEAPLDVYEDDLPSEDFFDPADVTVQFAPRSSVLKTTAATTTTVAPSPSHTRAVIDAVLYPNKMTELVTRVRNRLKRACNTAVNRVRESWYRLRRRVRVSWCRVKCATKKRVRDTWSCMKRSVSSAARRSSRFVVSTVTGSETIQTSWMSLFLAIAFTLLVVLASPPRPVVVYNTGQGYNTPAWLKVYEASSDLLDVPERIQDLVLADVTLQRQYPRLFQNILEIYRERDRARERRRRENERWAEAAARLQQERLEQRKREEAFRERSKRFVEGYYQLLLATCSTDIILHSNTTHVTVTDGYHRVETFTGRMMIAKKLHLQVGYGYKNLPEVGLDGYTVPVERLSYSLLPAEDQRAVFEAEAATARFESLR